MFCSAKLIRLFKSTKKIVRFVIILSGQTGRVNINEVRLKRAEERTSSKKKTKREKCKMQKCTGITFLHVGRVHYYIRDNTPNGDTNTDNTNIDYDDEAIPLDLSMVICC